MKNNIISINGTQEFMGIEIPVIEGGFGEGKKCISDKAISEIHNMRNADIRRKVTDNISRFKIGIDFINIKGVYDVHTLVEMGYNKSSITQADNIYLLSERGYAKIIKMMDTDLAWEIHDKLIDEYFTLRELVKNSISAADMAILKIANSTTPEETSIAVREYRAIVTQPLIEELDKYSRFLCDKMSTLTKSELSIKLDVKPQTMAATLKKTGIYTKTSQVSSDFLKKYPDIKLIIETESVYTKNGVEHTKKDWQWTGEGAKTVVEYLIEKGMVTFTENDGFKLIRK